MAHVGRWESQHSTHPIDEIFAKFIIVFGFAIRIESQRGACEPTFKV